MDQMERRQFLRGVGVAGVVGLAGCGGSSDTGDAPPSTPPPSPTPTETPTASPTSTETPTASPTPTETPTASPTPTETPTSEFEGSIQEDRTYVDLQYRDYLEHEIQTIKDEATELSYDNLLRNAKDLEGKAIYLRGVVGQTITYDVVNYYLIFLTRSDFLYISYVGDRFIREDRVEIWGEVLGLEIYQTGAGSERTVPAVAAADMKPIE